MSAGLLYLKQKNYILYEKLHARRIMLFRDDGLVWLDGLWSWYITRLHVEYEYSTGREHHADDDGSNL